MEFALGAVGGEIVNGLRAFADRRRLAIDAVEVVVSGVLENGLTYLEVIGEQGQPEDRAHSRQGLRLCPGRRRHSRPVRSLLEQLPLVCTLRAALVLTTELVLTS